MYKRTPNRKYTYDSMCQRIHEASSLEELDLIMLLAEQLIDSKLLTTHQHTQLQDKRNMKAMELLCL